MHEMGIAQELVKIALDAIPGDMEHPKVETVYLKIGKLAAVVESSLTLCFKIITKDTPLEHAGLQIDFIPVVVQCKTCGHTRQLDNPIFQCPYCKDKSDVDIVAGREIEITSLKLAEE